MKRGKSVILWGAFIGAFGIQLAVLYTFILLIMDGLEHGVGKLTIYEEPVFAIFEVFLILICMFFLFALYYLILRRKL